VQINKISTLLQGIKNIYRHPPLVFKAFCRLPIPVIDKAIHSDKKYK